jgi:signal transduction histidine kinase
MDGGPYTGYREHVTSLETADARRRPGLLKAVLDAMRSARTRRATLHALLGLPTCLVAGTVIIGLVVVWVAAAWSLLDGPTGGWVLVVIYAVVVLAGPVVLPWCARAFGALQRARFRKALGVEIAPPRRAVGRWPMGPVRPWGAAATWRQLGYHVLGLVAGPAGAVLVLATFPAAPWVAPGVARLDERAARALLGPSRGEELAQRVETLARSRAEVVAATDAERRRIERDLHDGAQQRLVSLAMNLGMARANLADAPGPARQAIEQAHDEATQALAELRELVRGLHPAVLSDRGLDAALSGLAARAPLPVRLRVDLARRCSPSVEAVAYFVVSEALTNVAKHAQAQRAEVTAERAGERLRIVVSDDGRGGAAIAPHEGAAADGHRSGLRGLAQRVAAVDGTLTVHSPTGGPTTITVELPCES